MDRLSTLLPKVLRKHGIKDEADAALVVHTANQWLQEQGGILTTSVAAMRFARNTLTLCTQSSVAAEEVRGKNEELLSALRERLPGIVVETVHIVRR